METAENAAPKQHIFIHGLGQKASAWDKVILSLTVPGHIHCPSLFTMVPPKDLLYANIYRAFAANCNVLPGKLHLCGLSLGAMLALQYSIEFPDKVASLVLIGAQVKTPNMLLKLQNVIFQLMPAKSFALHGMEKKPFIKLADSMVGLDFSKQLHRINCPTLVVIGDKDAPNRKAADTLTERIPNASMEILAGVGHEINTEAPIKLASLIQDFWVN